MSSAGVEILVVEDEESIASFVSLYLKNAGYEVRTAATGSAALAEVQAWFDASIPADKRGAYLKEPA